jgi:hypothetical protein
MPIEGASKGRSGEARRDLRFELRLGAALRTDAGVALVDLLDVSRGGALVAARLPLAIGARVTLLLERLEVEARVVRASAAQVGLAFDRRIRATELFFQLGRSRTAAKPEAPPAQASGPAVAA